MKTKPSPSLSFIFVIIITITTIVGTISFSLHQSAFAQNSKFVTNLLSSNEVPWVIQRLQVWQNLRQWVIV
jgi:hypothetical protein